ncbi:alpha/beta hydrolase [Microlunatus endophyticus]|uniref:Alpha/beta hydrolase n=1 Tax=Microlunatus endophyticus TaxID=1716077 RepID=A0A917S1C7_9ACTN|nr:alpha/beta hydrolase [Microlunatus endophyticus]GGL50400.1 alpha/beta hydrolase [Microlunatus endophyticus]
MTSIEVRQRVRFAGGSDTVVGWHYPGTNGACVVMAPGGGATKEPGTDRFAARFHAAGYSVLAFDFRHLGESGGTPRQVIRIREQVADLEAAIQHAASLPEVDSARIACWGFSLAGGHLFRIAARTPGVAAVISQSPLADNLVASPKALRYESPGVALRFPLIAAADAIGGLFGRVPHVIPLAGPRGTVAMLSTPDALDGAAALDPDGRYPEWKQTIAARSVLPLMAYRPGRDAAKARCPMLVVICEQDLTALAAPAHKAAARIPDAEVLSVPGGHYAPFLDQHEVVVAAELDYLQRRVLQTV